MKRPSRARMIELARALIRQHVRLPDDYGSFDWADDVDGDTLRDQNERTPQELWTTWPLVYEPIHTRLVCFVSWDRGTLKGRLHAQTDQHQPHWTVEYQYRETTAAWVRV